GETLALTGENGAGKSTLIALIMRLVEPQAGQVLIDGQDISRAELASLRRQIAIVPQHVFLFHGTVRENIGFGRAGATDSDIRQAALLAQAHGFIEDLPSGYETVVGDQGVRLSGGQRQRLALARALLKNPAILILDEATSMFDPAAELDFLRDCAPVFEGRTVILVTHRPASLELATRILRLDPTGASMVPQLNIDSPGAESVASAVLKSK
ncbi:MAG: ATP-binding cassette domain-containing protein, partial [Burkholderiaceae bacterium]|nr:ATP-binding cassette domain-containing protein [Burkholderiaceae bacterium]